MISFRPLLPRLALVLLVAGAIAPAPALAQDSADLEKAKERFREGRDMFENKDFAGAADAFEEAYELSKRTELLYNVGLAYQSAGKLKKAEKYLQQYLSASPDAENSDEVIEIIVELQAEIESTYGAVQVRSKEPGRSVFVDGEKRASCKTPCTLDLPAGEHAVVVKGREVRPAEERVKVEPGAKATLDVVLKSLTEKGQLVVETGGAGELTVGDTTVPIPMDQPLGLSAGRHQITVRGDGTSWSGSVDVKTDETLHVLVPVDDISSSDGLYRTLSYVSLGVGGALLLGGALMGLEASATHDALTAASRSGPVDARFVERGESEQLAANILFAGGAVFTLGGAGLLAWDMFFRGGEDEAIPPSEPSEPSTAPDSDVELLE